MGTGPLIDCLCDRFLQANYPFSVMALDLITYFGIQAEEGLSLNSDEVTDKAGYRHFHCIVHLKERTSSFKKLNEICSLPNTTHWELVKFATNALNYCRKDSVPGVLHPFQHYGSLTKKGQRVDLEELHRLITDNTWPSFDHLLLDPDFGPLACKYGNQINKVFVSLFRLRASSVRPVNVITFVGESGSGKSMTARMICEAYNITFYTITKTADTCWIDGYFNQQALIIDEVDKGQMTFGLLLNVLDIYKLQMPVKGGLVQAHWNLVFLTANSFPNVWYKNGLGAEHELWRRISKNCFHFSINKDGGHPIVSRVVLQKSPLLSTDVPPCFLSENQVNQTNLLVHCCVLGERVDYSSLPDICGTLPSPLTPFVNPFVKTNPERNNI